MTLREILAAKGNAVQTIGPNASLRDVAHKLVKHRIGALLVFEEGTALEAERMLGVISERDLLRAYASDDASLGRLRVAEVMTTQVITAAPDARVADVMGLLTDRRIRHLPVVADGHVVGMVSIGDVVKSQHDQMAIENRFMKDYISG